MGNGIEGAFIRNKGFSRHVSGIAFNLGDAGEDVV
jgi:hypothetical protein